MFRWFEDVGYDADIEALRPMHPDLADFDAYLDRAGWRERAAA